MNEKIAFMHVIICLSLFLILEMRNLKGEKFQSTRLHMQAREIAQWCRATRKTQFQSSILGIKVEKKKKKRLYVHNLIIHNNGDAVITFGKLHHSFMRNEREIGK